MFESVVVALDGSSRDHVALAMADAVATAAGCRLDLLHVCPSQERRATAMRLALLADGVAASVGDATAVPAGQVVEALVAEQGAHPRSLLCLATHARTGPLELAFGGHAGSLLHEARRPLLLVGPRAGVPADLRTVQVCLDSRPDSARALLAAEAWARGVGGRLHLTTVVRGRDRGSLAELAERTSEETGLFVDAAVLHGLDPVAPLVDHARRLPASVLAVATRADASMHRRLLGSTSLRLVRHATVPVLVQRAG